MLNILTFNILAPNFANPSYYLPGMDVLLSQESRRQGTTRFLHRIMDVCDIIAFQEVTNDPKSYDEFTYLVDLLGDEFIGAFVSHDLHYWSELDYHVVNGNALFFRRALFSEPVWYDVSLMTGNHAIRADVTHLPTMRNFRILNIHLDSDKKDRRDYELMMALDSLPLDPNTTDLIMGDFNMETSDPSYSVVRRAGFRDCLYDLGINTPTFFSMVAEPIDHIIYRDITGGALYLIPGKSLDIGLWSKFPKIGPFDMLAGPRLKEYLTLYGSDHTPVLITFQVAPIMM